MEDRSRRAEEIAELPLPLRVAAIEEILARLEQLETRVGELTAKVNQCSANSSRPPVVGAGVDRQRGNQVAVVVGC